METQNANQQISQEKFTISSDKDNSFNLIFQNRKSTIYISASFQSEIKKIEYEKNYNLEELKANKYLSLFDTINETYEEIISIIKQRKSEIKLQDIEVASVQFLTEKQIQKLIKEGKFLESHAYIYKNYIMK